MITKSKLHWEADVWCPLCGNARCGLRGAAEARRLGWRNTRKYGWICPDCVKGGRDVRQAE